MVCCWFNAVVAIAFTAAFNLSIHFSLFIFIFAILFNLRFLLQVFTFLFFIFIFFLFSFPIWHVAWSKLLMLLSTFLFSLYNSQALLGIRCLIFYFVHAKHFPNRFNWFSYRANKMKFFFCPSGYSVINGVAVIYSKNEKKPHASIQPTRWFHIFDRQILVANIQNDCINFRTSV